MPEYQIKATAEVEDVLRRLARVEPAIERKVLPSACRAGAAPQAKAAKRILRGMISNYSKPRSGMLAKSLRVRAGKRTHRGVVTAIVMAGRKDVGIYKGKTNKPSKYQHLVELGHRIVVRQSGGKTERGFVLKRADGREIGGSLGRHAGNVPPRPFLNRAFEQTKYLAVAAFTKVVKEKLDKSDALFTALGEYARGK
jgi:hypothetical protein